MTTPLETRNEHLANHLIKQLKKRNMEAMYCTTAQQAIEKVKEMIPTRASVTWGGSMTLRDMGLTRALHEAGCYQLFDRDLAKSPEEAQEIYRKAFSADFYLSSANALSEDGVIVNIDGNGNRVAAITFGPKHVIFVISLQKVAHNVEAALARARGTAAPINAARFDINTPCKIDGICHNCNSPQSICNHIHLLRNSKLGRISVILLAEEYGY